MSGDAPIQHRNFTRLALQLASFADSQEIAAPNCRAVIHVTVSAAEARALSKVIFAMLDIN